MSKPDLSKEQRAKIQILNQHGSTHAEAARRLAVTGDAVWSHVRPRAVGATDGRQAKTCLTASAELVRVVGSVADWPCRGLPATECRLAASAPPRGAWIQRLVQVGAEVRRDAQQPPEGASSATPPADGPPDRALGHLRPHAIRLSARSLPDRRGGVRTRGAGLHPAEIAVERQGPRGDPDAIVPEASGRAGTSDRSRSLIAANDRWRVIGRKFRTW